MVWAAAKLARPIVIKMRSYATGPSDDWPMRPLAGILSLHVREQTPHVNSEQRATLRPSETVGKFYQKRSKQLSKLCDILN